MTSYETVFDGSVGSGSSETSDAIDVFSHETMSLKFDGDTNSGNIDLRVEGRLFEDGSFGSYQDDFGVNLTSGANNSAILTYNVSDLNDARVVVANNGDSATDVVVKSGATRGVQD